MPYSRSSRRLALLACLAAAAGLLSCADSGADRAAPTRAGGDPAPVVLDFVRGLQPSGPYRDPTAAERRRAVQGIGLLLDGPAKLDEAVPVLAELGFSVKRGRDQDTSREYALFMNEPDSDRAWGIILVDLSAPVRLAVEVPHPNSDLRTEELGMKLFRRLPGAILLVAGAHRRASNEDGDVAHNRDSLFQTAARQFARRQINQVQLHGFAKQSLPDEEIVVSSGNSAAPAPPRRLAKELAQAGFQTCRAWEQRCGRLEGTTNVQADDANAQRAVFIHLEITWLVRADPTHQDDLIDALARADLAGS